MGQSLVDPDHVGRRVVEIALQCREPGDGVEHLPCSRLAVEEGGRAAGQAAFVVLRDDPVDDATQRCGVCCGVEPMAAHELAAASSSTSIAFAAHETEAIFRAAPDSTKQSRSAEELSVTL